MKLSSAAQGLLEWIGGPGAAQYGECNGPTLDYLIAKGLAEVKNGREHQTEFIVQGDGIMYQAVVLTDAGRRLLAETH